MQTIILLCPLTVIWDFPWKYSFNNWKNWTLLKVSWSALLLLLSRFSRVRLRATLETAAHQAPLSLEFSRQEHWSGLPFPSAMHQSEKWKWSRAVVSDSYRPHGLQPTRLLHPWDFPGKRYWSEVPLPSPGLYWLPQINKGPCILRRNRVSEEAGGNVIK